MPLPPGTYPIGGPIVPTAAARLPASQELMDAGVALLEGGRWFRVKPTGNPANPFDWFVDDAAGLPPGSAVLNRLQFNPIADAWQAVSDVTTLYFALTRTGDGAELVEAIQYGLNNDGRTFPESGDATRMLAFTITYGQSTGTFAETETTKRINNVWQDGAPAPFVWACAPGHTGWINGFGFEYTREGTDIPNQPAMQVARDFVRIGGVPYDAAFAQVVGDRPPDMSDTRAGNIRVSYTAPLQPPLVVELI